MRNPRLIETLVLVSAGLAFSDGIASKIICEHSQLDDLPWVEGHLESADVVLLGTVISAEFPEPPESEEPTPKTEQEESPAASIADLLRRIEEGQRKTNSDQSVSFEVVKIWKGPPYKVFTAKNRVVPGQYGKPLKESITYLVFGYKREEGVHTISTVCGSTQIAKNVQERIEILNELAERNKPPNNALR